MERVKTVMEILDKMNFFQGQRAGRELWNDKPFEVQEEDLENFKRDINTIESYIWEIVKELKQYRDAEEQGLLLRLPCKVGDTVYLVDFEEKTWDEATVNSIEIDTRDNRVLINSDYEVGTWSEDSYVFYSKEEAEAALAKMKEGVI